MNAVNKVFEENERSELFKLHFTKMKVVFVKARRDVKKKRIRNGTYDESNDNVEEDEEGKFVNMIKNT